MRALLIDDSRATRAFLRRMLVELGFDVIEAANGVEGLARIAEADDDFTIALVDWHMPEMNGLEFLRSFRQTHPTSSMKTVMVSSVTDPDRIGEVIESGVADYLMKPFTKDALLSKLSLVGIDV